MKSESQKNETSSKNNVDYVNCEWSAVSGEQSRIVLLTTDNSLLTNSTA